MIVEYFRPQSIDETLDLIAHQKMNTVVMGGGTAIDRFNTVPFAVVDLQDVGLGNLRAKGNFLEVGATVTLQSLYEETRIQEVLKETILREATQNLRQVATVAGTLVASDRRSPFTSALLALDASVTLLPGEEKISLGDLLITRESKLRSKLIAKITIQTNVQLAYEDVARTPADLPIVCAALAVWPAGRTRVILGGFGEVPVLASDGPERGGEEAAAADAYSHAGDQWASAAYRQEIAPVLVKRCFSRLIE